MAWQVSKHLPCGEAARRMYRTYGDRNGVGWSG